MTDRKYIPMIETEADDAAFSALLEVVDNPWVRTAATTIAPVMP